MSPRGATIGRGGRWLAGLLSAAAALAVTLMVLVIGILVGLGAQDLAGVHVATLSLSLAVTALLPVAALGVAAPVAIGVALWVCWLAPPPARSSGRLLIDLLGDVPPVFWAVGATLCPGWDRTEVVVVLAVLALAAVAAPTIARRSLRALDTVPSSRMLAARALGASQAEAIVSLGLPFARRGLVRATLLGLSRALADSVIAVVVVSVLHPRAMLPLWLLPGGEVSVGGVPAGALAVMAIWAALSTALVVVARRVPR